MVRAPRVQKADIVSLVSNIVKLITGQRRRESSCEAGISIRRSRREQASSTVARASQGVRHINVAYMIGVEFAVMVRYTSVRSGY